MKLKQNFILELKSIMKMMQKFVQKLIDMGIKKVIITLGEKGLFYSDGKEDIYIKATQIKLLILPEQETHLMEDFPLHY